MTLQSSQMSTRCSVLQIHVPNSLADVLGFNRSTYVIGRHAGDQLVNIMSIYSILVHFNIVHSSYMRGVQAPVVCNFSPNAAPGQKILEAPSNLDL